mmetsp:Transcript_7358/g.15032  ORF Transcript_7358/g.15032 Transcript_7358/m.15032 type:complete len:278 (-) Transcript_7358:1668-2501(-)
MRVPRMRLSRVLLPPRRSFPTSTQPTHPTPPTTRVVGDPRALSKPSLRWLETPRPTESTTVRHLSRISRPTMDPSPTSTQRPRSISSTDLQNSKDTKVRTLFRSHRRWLFQVMGFAAVGQSALWMTGNYLATFQDRQDLVLFTGWGWSLFGLGLTCAFVGMVWIYSRRYVAALYLDEREPLSLIIHTYSLFGVEREPRVVPLIWLVEGRKRSKDQFWTFRFRGDRLHYLIDANRELVEQELVEAIALGDPVRVTALVRAGDKCPSKPSTRNVRRKRR